MAGVFLKTGVLALVEFVVDHVFLSAGCLQQGGPQQRYPYRQIPMKSIFAFLIAIPAALLCVSAASASTGSPSSVVRVVDPLERPALISKRATRAVLLDVTRAGNRLVAVGERGTVLLSDDNGHSWRQAKTVPVAVGLTRIAFVTAEQGWIVGHSGIVLHSADGGETWTRQLDGKTAATLAVKAAETDAATHPGDPEAGRRLQDAQRLVQDGADKPLLDLYFSDAQHGFVVGAYGLVFRTDDGGHSWQPWMAMTENPKGLHLNAIAAVGNAIYIVGERGLVLRANDRAGYFAAVKTPYAGSFFTICAAGGSAIIGGLRGNAFASADQGRSWTPVAVPIAVTLTSVAALADGRHLFINQAGQLLLSNDGASMRPLPLPPSPPLNAVVQAADGGLVAASFGGALRLPPAP